GGCRARSRRRAAHVPQPGPGWRRHAVPAACHRRRPARLDRDPDVRLARDLRALPARPRTLGLTTSGGALTRIRARVPGLDGSAQTPADPGGPHVAHNTLWPYW